MRRPRVVFVTPSPGGPGQAVRWHYDRLPSMAGRRGDDGRRKLAGSGARDGPRRSPEARRQGQKAPRVARREAPRLRALRRAQKEMAAPCRRLIPSHVGERGKRRGLRANPAPRQRIRALLYAQCVPRSAVKCRPCNIENYRYLVETSSHTVARAPDCITSPRRLACGRTRLPRRPGAEFSF